MAVGELFRFCRRFFDFYEAYEGQPIQDEAAQKELVDRGAIGGRFLPTSGELRSGEGMTSVPMRSCTASAATRCCSGLCKAF